MDPAPPAAGAPTRRGLFLSFEGIDGSGKSTQARLLAQALARTGLEVTLTREPGGSPGAEQIRRLLVEGRADRWSAETEILLFTAARRDHLERTIRPALDRGAVVITDRFADSTRVYQGAARGALNATVDALHRLMIGVEPDLTLVIDLDPAQALDRAGRRGAGLDRAAPASPVTSRGGALATDHPPAAAAAGVAEPAPTGRPAWPDPPVGAGGDFARGVAGAAPASPATSSGGATATDHPFADAPAAAAEPAPTAPLAWPEAPAGTARDPALGSHLAAPASPAASGEGAIATDHPSAATPAAAEDRFESMGLAFQHRLRDGFVALAAAHPGRVRLIDGTGTPDAVAARVIAALPPALRDALPAPPGGGGQAPHGVATPPPRGPCR